MTFHGVVNSRSPTELGAARGKTLLGLKPAPEITI